MRSLPLSVSCFPTNNFTLFASYIYQNNSKDTPTIAKWMSYYYLLFDGPYLVLKWIQNIKLLSLKTDFISLHKNRKLSSFIGSVGFVDFLHLSFSLYVKVTFGYENSHCIEVLNVELCCAIKHHLLVHHGIQFRFTSDPQLSYGSGK